MVKEKRKVKQNKMTEKEAEIFLQMYQKNKKIEKIKILNIEEYEINALTAKGISYDEKTPGGKSILPDYVYSKIFDLKENLVRGIYRNTILFKYLEKYIYEVATYDTVSATILCLKYSKGYKNIQIEQYLSYSKQHVIDLLKKSKEILVKRVLCKVNFHELMQRIEDESCITREELDNYYAKIM